MFIATVVNIKLLAPKERNVFEDRELHCAPMERVEAFVNRFYRHLVPNGTTRLHRSQMFIATAPLKHKIAPKERDVYSYGCKYQAPRSIERNVVEDRELHCAPTERVEAFVNRFYRHLVPNGTTRLRREPNVYSYFVNIKLLAPKERDVWG